jgi:hypothetical protein
MRSGDFVALQASAAGPSHLPQALLMVAVAQLRCCTASLLHSFHRSTVLSARRLAFPRATRIPEAISGRADA